MSNKNLEVALKIAAQTSGSKEIGALVDELDHVAVSEEKAGKEAAELSQELTQLTNQQNLINSFKKTATTLEKQELATIAAARGLEKLQKEAQDTSKPFVDVARSINAAEKDLTEMRSELTKQTGKHNKLQQELKETGVTTDNLTGKKRELAAGFKQVGKRIDTYTNQLKQGTAAERKHSQGLQNVTRNIIALSAGYIGLNQVGSAIKDIFTTGDNFERLGVQMSALMGSISEGERATAWVKEFGKKTPLQIQEVSKAFVKLKAFGLDPMNGTLQSITDSAFKMGGGFQEVEGISLALGQAWAKQKLQGEEINQLVERGIPVWSLLEKVTGKNTQELQKLSSAGKLGRDTIKALIDEMGKQSVGAAADNMKLLSGLVSNAKDNIDIFYNLVSESGAMDYLKGELAFLNTEFDAMAKDGRLQEWAQKISDAIVSTSEAIKKTFTTIYEYRSEIALVAKAYLALKVGSYFSGVISGSIKAIAALKTYRIGIAATTAATNTGAVAAGKWKNAVKFAARGALYTALISQLVEVGFLYKDLLLKEASVEKSQKLAADQTAKLAEKLKILSTQTGINITSTEQYFALVDKGTIVFDKLSNKMVNVADQQNNLTESTKQTAIEEAKQQLIIGTSAERLAAKYKLISLQTDLNITSTEQYIKLVSDGVIVFDQATGQMLNFAAQQIKLAASTKQAAAEEAQRQQLTTLTLKQAIDTTLQLENQALSLNKVRGGVQGFITAIDSAKATLSGAGEQYSQQIVLLDQLKAKYEAHNESLERQAYLAGDVNAAYKVLGIESGKALEELADKQRGAFELIQQSEEPLELQHKAYLKWAGSALKVAEATGGMVPPSLKAAAAALGLTQELEKLIEKQKLLKPALDDDSDAVKRFQLAVDNTAKAIATNKKVLSSSTATMKEKTEAQKALIIQEERLKQETADLTRIQGFEVTKLAELQAEKRKLTSSLEKLNREYKAGRIDSTQYNDEKDRLNELLQVSNNLLGDFSNATDKATDSTKNNTRAQKESNSTTDKTIASRRRLTQAYKDERQAVGELESAWGNTRLASGNPSSNNGSNYSSNGSGLDNRGASPETIARFEDDNNIPEHLRNTSQAVADYRRGYSATRNILDDFNNVLKQLESARNNSRQLDALLAKFSGPFGGLTKGQVSQLKNVVEGYKNTIKGITSTKKNTQKKATQNYSDYQPQLSSDYSNDYGSTVGNDKLAASINALVKLLSSNSASVNNTPKQSVRLELIIGGETFKADLLEQFEDTFLNKIEQARAVSGVGYTG